VLALQAGVVALPRVPPGAERLRRLAGRGWAAVPLGSIVVVVFAIRFVSDTATALTYLALVAVPPLAAAAIAWAMRGARSLTAAVVVAAALFALAWADRAGLPGEGAAALLSALSCVTLGVLLAAVTPPLWLKLGIVLMAGADTWLVITDLLQAPNATLIAAHPGGGLPRLQSVLFGSVSLGYGDLFAAALLGAVIALEHRDGRRRAALLTFAIASLFDLLFLVLDELPATVPVALALIVLELRRRRPAPIAEQISAPGRRPWKPAGGTPPPRR
jgi:hypothetical protein